MSQRKTMSSAMSIAVTAVFAAAACTREPPHAEHSVAEYRADAKLRHEMFARCINDPGTLSKTPDCVNAGEAERVEGVGTVRDAPPVGLTSTPQR